MIKILQKKLDGLYFNNPEMLATYESINAMHYYIRIVVVNCLELMGDCKSP